METSRLLFGLIVVCLVIQGVQPFLKTSVTSQRRLYWGCAIVVCVALCLMVQPDWRDGIIGGALFFVGMTIAAYSYTPYLKVAGKVFALNSYACEEETKDDSETPDDDPNPDSYSGIITAEKYWWIALIPAFTGTVNVYAFYAGRGEGWVAMSGVVLLFVIAAISGVGDASWGYPIARGQYLQFGLVAAITVGYFPAVYLIAYYLGKRHPLRRKQSMEYRAHPRHRRTP